MSSIMEVSNNNDNISLIDQNENIEIIEEKKQVKKISNKFWIYGIVEKSKEDLLKILNGRNGICELSYKISDSQSLKDIQNYICGLMNGNIPIKYFNIINVKSKKDRLLKGGCRYGISCHSGISNPEAEHSHAHTITQLIAYNILNKLYDIKISKEDIDVAIATNKFFYKLPPNMLAVPRTELNVEKLNQILTKKIPAFFAGLDTWNRIGNLDNPACKWCGFTVCFNYIKDNRCPLRHDEDTSFLSILLRLLIKIIVKKGKTKKIVKTENITIDEENGKSEKTTIASNPFDVLNDETEIHLNNEEL